MLAPRMRTTALKRGFLLAGARGAGGPVLRRRIALRGSRCTGLPTADVRERALAGGVPLGDGELHQRDRLGRGAVRQRLRRQARPRSTSTSAGRWRPGTDCNLKVPVYLRGQPVLREPRAEPQLGGRPRDRLAACDAGPAEPYFNASNTRNPTISTIYESVWVPRGFAVMHAESPGTGHSDGCPTSGGAERVARREGRDRLAERPGDRVHDALRGRRR